MLNKYKNFRELPVWKLAHEMVLEIYKLTAKFPKKEDYGLTSQIRRFASSVPANIVEGIYRQSLKELSKFLYNARGSCGETIYHLLLAKDLGYISENEWNITSDKYEEIAKQLNGWLKSFKLRINN